MKKTIDNISFRFVYTAVYLSSLLPMWFLYRLSTIAHIVMLHIVSYRKQVVIQNLSRSFPEKNYKEIKQITKEFYRSFADNFAEILKTTSISFKDQVEKVTLINFDIVEKEINEGRSIIVSMSHCGNWEVLNILPDLLGINSYAVYKPLRAKVMDRFFLKLRSRFGMKLIPSKSVIRHFILNKSNPSLYFLLADQCPKVVEEKYRFNFLHQPTSTFSGIEKLARSTGSTVVYMHVIKTGRGTYTAECKLISETPKETKETEITESYMHLLEQNIQEKPSSWLWTHKRWKR